ncbi:hypothetical protein [Arthrobacter sp. H14]|uniref:hypothetical protein n=1 Tax=Arthrobacter sp. H14 TaxID=1312959 RepID=UPI0004B467BD|nr:hypothetical protein [Arthrobacter sp. H14]
MSNSGTRAKVQSVNWRLSFLVLLCLMVAGAVPLSAAPGAGAAPGNGGGGKGGSNNLLGNDVSWPQCGGALPEGQAFAIVGVNDGRANGTNPCLAEQLAWAQLSSGGTGQPNVALYVNTGNPELAGSWWPESNEYGGTVVNNPYGTCDGTATAACAYMYGYAKAYDDAKIRGINNPSSYLWWLDVELGNSWSTDKRANRADLEGMTAYFHSIGAKVGLYSTTYQWGEIVGQVGAESNLYYLDSWIPGARTARSAKSNCSAAPLTAGGTVTVTQFVSRGFDYDHSCI